MSHSNCNYSATYGKFANAFHLKALVRHPCREGVSETLILFPLKSGVAAEHLQPSPFYMACLLISPSHTCVRSYAVLTHGMAYVNLFIFLPIWEMYAETPWVALAMPNLPSNSTKLTQPTYCALPKTPMFAFPHEGWFVKLLFFATHICPNIASCSTDSLTHALTFLCHFEGPHIMKLPLTER